jgi:hypothetical protein
LSKLNIAWARRANSNKGEGNWIVQTQHCLLLVEPCGDNGCTIASFPKEATAIEAEQHNLVPDGTNRGATKIVEVSIPGLGDAAPKK